MTERSWEYELADRAASLLAGQYVDLPRCYFEPNARKLRFPPGRGDGEDITIEIPATPPDDLDAAAREAVKRYIALLPHPLSGGVLYVREDEKPS